MVISSNAACHIKVKNPDDEAGINAIIEDLKQFEAADVYKKVIPVYTQEKIQNCFLYFLGGYSGLASFQG